MKVLVAYLLTNLAGNNEPYAKDLMNTSWSSGWGDRLEQRLSQVKGKDLAEVVASGREKMALVVSTAITPFGVAASAGVVRALVAVEPTKEEEEAEEKK